MKMEVDGAEVFIILRMVISDIFDLIKRITAASSVISACPAVGFDIGAEQAVEEGNRVKQPRARRGGTAAVRRAK